MQTRKISNILKISIFATGCAGIVAEFVLSTLATYLSGNAVFQWTIVMSLMLFAMGIGSRLTIFFAKNLIDTFIKIEFLLSIMCASSAFISYGLLVFTSNIHIIIYLLAALIGCLIGMEIPMVTRLNEEYEELRINISSVLEKDYYGSLLGGLLFAFIALPYLGLTYTPIILGTVNFIVASFMMFCFFSYLNNKSLNTFLFFLCFIILICLFIFSKPIILFGEQSKYKDKIIFEKQTAYQKIVITQWKNYYWLYLNSQQQFSTYDEMRYHEPLVHPVVKLSINSQNVLILGGGDGLAVREVLKHKNVKKITLVDLDPAMTDLAKNNNILANINKSSMNDKRVKILNNDALTFLEQCNDLFGVIIVDLPDPDTIDLMHVYSLDFYKLIYRHLIKGGVFVTQATSPFFAKMAFLCIIKTINSSDFYTFPYHNHIPTMGEWGFVIGAKNKDITESLLREKILNSDFSDIDTGFINNDAMISMSYFGKGIFESKNNVNVNTNLNPILHKYYSKGSWGMY